MSYRLPASRPPEAGLRRVAREQLQQAAAALRRKLRPAHRVHDARRNLKKVRALVRLGRRPAGAMFFNAENRRLRDLARRLAPMRDAQVVIRTLRQLAARSADRHARRALKKLQRLVAAPRAADEATLRAIADELAGLALAVERWPVEGLDWPGLTASLTRTYRRARLEREHFRLNPRLENLHEWRKRAKDLQHQLFAMDVIVRNPLRKLARDLDRLTEAQGHMHDLGMVEAAAAHHARRLKLLDRTAVREAVSARMSELESTVARRGTKLFRSTPDRFARALRREPR